MGRGTGRTLLGPLLLVLGACSSLEDTDARPPLAVIRGQLTTDAGSPGVGGAANVRVAIVWAAAGEHRAFKVAQDVQVNPVFPSKFSLELADPPPAEAMDDVGVTGPQPSPYPENFAVATGTLVAYEDRNGNGMLDLLDADATTGADRVLGVNRDLSIEYLEGDVPEVAPPATIWGIWLLDGRLPKRGYNLVKRPYCPIRLVPGGTNWAPGWEDRPQCRQGAQWLPSDTLVELLLSGEPKLAPVMCKSEVPEPFVPLAGKPPDVTLPPAPGPEGWPTKAKPTFCAHDGSYYLVATCTSVSPGLCQTSETTCTTAGYSKPSGEVPPEWPCD